MSDEIKVTIPAAMTNPLAYIEDYCKRNKISVTAGGHYVGPRGKATLDAVLLDYMEMYKGARATLKQHGFKITQLEKFTQIELKAALSQYAISQQEQMRGKFTTGLEFDGSNSDELDKWLLAVTGKNDVLDKYAIQHFLWQVKRKMYGKHVVYHLVTFLFGSQGSGKSKALEALIKPLKELTVHFSPPEAMDSRNYQALADNLICVFDEMSGVETRVEMEGFKRLISTDDLSYRPLHTNTLCQVRQNCTFIGTSNKSISQIINDPTGIRRFYQINCLAPTNMSQNWEIINNIDAKKIWKSIDESLDKGYGAEHREALAKHQENLINLGEIPTFIKENNLLVSDKGYTLMTIQELHIKYQAWRQNFWGPKPIAINYFSGHLQTHGLEKTRLTSGPKIFQTVFKVNKQAFGGEQAATTNIAEFRKINE